MDLLDRYLNAVRSFLPPGQQEDIVDELRANLQSEVEDREVELGRSLSESEQEAILQRHGHPMLVAGNYQGNQGSVVFGRKLIGATLFPLYRKVLWINLSVTFAIYLIALIALDVSGQVIAFDDVLNAVLLLIIFQCAIVTGIFTAAEYYLPAMPWNVHRPPVLHPMLRQGQQRFQLEPVAEVAAILIFLFWLGVFLARPALLFGSGTLTYQLGLVWYQVGWFLALVAVAHLAWTVATLVRPEWGRSRRVVRVASDLVVLGIVVYLLQAGHWIVLAHSTGQASNMLGTINQYVYFGLIPTVISVGVVTLIDGWRLLWREQIRSA